MAAGTGRGVGVSTHRRAWFIRAGVVVLLASASLFGLASPALAADRSGRLQAITVDPSTVNPGQQVTVKFTVKNTGDPGTITVEVSSSSGS